jgi:hypothetical protein
MGDSWVKAINKPDDKAVELSFREAINSLTDDEKETLRRMREQSALKRRQDSLRNPNEDQ